MKERVKAVVNLDAIEHNYKQVCKVIHNSSKVMAVVKADAYGHGSVEVSTFLESLGVEHFGVAFSREGEILREHGIASDILILGFTPEEKLYKVVENNLTQTIFSLDTAKKLSAIASEMNTKVKVHLKIETGMNRLGFSATNESIAVIKEISSLPGLIIEGIFTHLADADDANSQFSYEQNEKFLCIIKKLESFSINFKYKHVSNSAAITSFSGINSDLVRTGILLYGLCPSDYPNFPRLTVTPAMSLISQISHLNTINIGESVGYGRSFYAKKKTIIATVPVGYADGYFRTLGNKACVLICGKTANIIGNICMDQLMVDVTDIPNSKIGDEVILIGSSADKTISADYLAKTCNTINYEIVCNISRRVPREYIRNNIVSKFINYM